MNGCLGRYLWIIPTTARCCCCLPPLWLMRSGTLRRSGCTQSRKVGAWRIFLVFKSVRQRSLHGNPQQIHLRRLRRSQLCSFLTLRYSRNVSPLKNELWRGAACCAMTFLPAGSAMSICILTSVIFLRRCCLTSRFSAVYWGTWTRKSTATYNCKGCAV